MHLAPAGASGTLAKNSTDLFTKPVLSDASNDPASEVYSAAEGRYCTWSGCSHNLEGSSYLGEGQVVGIKKLGLLSSSSSFELWGGSALILGHHISGRPSGCPSLSFRHVTSAVHPHPLMQSAGMSGAAWQYRLLRPPNHPQYKGFGLPL